MALLVQVLQEDARIAIRAARILAAWPKEEATDALINIVESGPTAARSRAALALGLRGDERAREPLERAANSDLKEVAVASLQALQDLDLLDSLPTLEAISAHASDIRVREAAENAYNLIARSFLASNAEHPMDVIEGESK
jgi:HEAT repeat protein